MTGALSFGLKTTAAQPSTDIPLNSARAVANEALTGEVDPVNLAGGITLGLNSQHGHYAISVEGEFNFLTLTRIATPAPSATAAPEGAGIMS